MKTATSDTKSQVLIGLNVAIRRHFILEIDETADELIAFKDQGNIGIVVIEQTPFVASVIAVNYAYSIGADISIVEPLEKDGDLRMLNYIEEWQQGDKSKLDELKEVVDERIGTLNFDQYQFVTFFTTGIPYSLFINNCIPCSYVNLKLEADLFIIHNFIYYKNYQLSGAVVFSPQFFEKEEIENVSNELEGQNYFVKRLTGDSATVLELDMHLKEFPYNIFHICSHGGEIEGHRVEESFVDSSGRNHVIEYDSVLSFSPSSRKGLISVQHKTYFKKFDGFIWKSPELKNQNYPNSLFAEMQNAMSKSLASQKKIIGKRHKIPNSCGIQCSNSVHQGMIGHLASHSSPIIFNNTCWSWHQIAENFLVSGARGYIGTLWPVDNESAVNFAIEFYKRISSATLINAIHEANKTLSDSSKNIYIFWGLHFTKVNNQDEREKSRLDVLKNLITSFNLWKAKLSFPLNQTSELIVDLMKWIMYEMSTNFTHQDFELLKGKFKSKK